MSVFRFFDNLYPNCTDRKFERDATVIVQGVYGQYEGVVVEVSTNRSQCLSVYWVRRKDGQPWIPGVELIGVTADDLYSVH